jgi:methylated-DNA-[protein]-cysteine S-methyltransferase
MTIHSSVLQTPIGPLSLLTLDIDGTQTLVASGFTADPGELYARMHPALAENELVSATEPGPIGKAHESYFAGDLDALDDVPVYQPGSERLVALWTELRKVGAGETVTYGELADRAGIPRGARVAGAACSRNLIAPAIPCHRVLPASGPAKYGHYLYGVDRKEWLLDHETAG